MKRYIPLFLGLAVIGLFIFGCETIVDQKPDTDVSLSTSDLSGAHSGELCQSTCIDPLEPEYIEIDESQTVQWGNPRNPFTKTVDITYYNTLTHFVLKVKSTHNIADVLMDDESIKNFKGTVPPGTEQEFTFELEEGWEACDTWAFELKVTGFGPPAYFDVEYQLIGECVYYTLGLAVNPAGAGTVTGEGEYKAGEDVELTATANEGYVFVNWTDEDGHEISELADFTYTMPAMNKTLIANFEEEEDVFVCGVSTITDINGNVYNTVLIDYQCWMAENLKVSRYQNGDDIPTGLSNIDWQNTTSGAYAIYPHGDVDGINSAEEMVNAYGKLYNWYAVVDNRGLCPEGWHVPSDGDWTILVNYVVAQGYLNEWHNPNGAGNALKSRRQVDSPLGAPWATGEHPRWNFHSTHYGQDVFGFQVFRAVTVTSMVITSTLESTVPGGVLRRAVLAMPGPDS